MHISVPSCSLRYDFDTTRHQLHNLAGPRDASIEMLGQSREQSRQPHMEMSRDPSHVLNEVINASSTKQGIHHSTSINLSR